MPRYFFNIYDGKDVFDLKGTEPPGPRDLRIHMVSTALAFFVDDEKSGDERWQMEALDERGKIVGAMNFGIDPKST